MARSARFERATTCLEGRCSIQLSYGRNPVEAIHRENAAQGWRGKKLFLRRLAGRNLRRKP